MFTVKVAENFIIFWGVGKWHSANQTLYGWIMSINSPIRSFYLFEIR